MTAENISAARSVPIESVVDQRGIKLRGRIERVGPCPICGGNDRFSINTRKQVFNCRGCNTGGDVITLVQHLDGCDFATACSTLAAPKSKANGKEWTKKVCVATFEYQDQSGKVAFVKDRFQTKKADGTFFLKNGKPEKTFRQRRPDPDRPGEWLWNTDGVPFLLYRLPEVSEAISNDHPIMVVEGENKADLLADWNIAATCNSGGAGKWKPPHAEFLRGADVVLVPDNDDPGWKHVHEVGASLVGFAKRVRVLVLPHAKAKDDIVDWVRNGGTREQLDSLLNDAQDWKPPSADETSEPNEEEKAKAKAREDELLDALAEAKGLDYFRQRKAAARELDVNLKDIDNEIKRRREDAEIAPLYGHWVVEPDPEPVEGDSLLRDIIRRFKRHVVITDDYVLTIALFIMMGAVHDDVATHSPILNINSAEPESGKSTTLGLISFLLPKCIASVEASEAAIYRAIKRWQPSFCFDEFDSVLADDDKAALRSIINSGHTKAQGVLRCVGDEKVPEFFPTFAPKVIGMVGRKLPPATQSRCIFIDLRRRRKGEYIEKFSHTDDDELASLRCRLRRWAIDTKEPSRLCRTNYRTGGPTIGPY